MSADAPVLFLIFNRPDTTRQVFEAIRSAKPQRLYIAADGPRAHVPDDTNKCQQCRDIVALVDWPCEVKTLFRENNMGCKKAVIQAIDWFFENEEYGIIIEDDCLPNQSFFPYCNELLERYANTPEVMMISGNNILNQTPPDGASYYFSRIFHIWGWASWRRAWNLYDKNLSEFTRRYNNNCLPEIDSDPNIRNYWIKTWAETSTGIINTWDYQWVYSCIASNSYSIAPCQNLVSNIGFDDNSTNTSDPNHFESNVATFTLKQIIHPQEIKYHKKLDISEYIASKVYPEQEVMALNYRLKRWSRRRKWLKKSNKIMLSTK